MNKRILFLSALDFKEKSIQVIRKTPEAYAKAGYQVDYFVARDNVLGGNYSYEDEIVLDDVNIKRIYWPFPNLRSKLPRILSLILTKFSGLFVVIRLALLGLKHVKNRPCDILYGYEMHGTLAVNLMRLFSFGRALKVVSRFQGTFLYEMISKKQFARLAFNLDLALAIRLSSDLLIMTNDGTQGDKAVNIIRGGSKNRNERFWVNGVDLIGVNSDCNIEKERGKILFITISRLVSWKKVDRAIRIVAAFSKISSREIEMRIIGGGENEKALRKLVTDLGVEDICLFVGPTSHSDVLVELFNSDVFISTYDSSNVGNPLLEAIRANKLIVTLNNGDTGSWINHLQNGLMYEPESDFVNDAACDLDKVFNDDALHHTLLTNLRKTEKERLWTWDERLKKEIDVVNSLFKID